MNYTETINYLYNRLPVFQHAGQSAYKAGLDNTILLDCHLGQPHSEYRTIHVAGTNGKGSVSHLVASVLQQAGYRVGLYTSPHLRDFRERIRVNGQMISEEYVCHFVEKEKLFIEAHDFSFFELTMGLAFQYFADEKVDVAVIEVGLGGRLDSTNIISPALSIITNISFDHMALLGNTLATIAAEKVGIIKKNTPVLIGEASDVRQIFEEKAKEENAPIIFAEDEKDFPSDLEVGLKGFYQQKNAKTAFVGIKILQQNDFNISEENIRQGFLKVAETTGLKGRWQTLQQNPTVICDTGHNEAGIRYIVQQLKTLNYEKLHIVLGVVSDKDVSAMLRLFPGEATSVYSAWTGLQSDDPKRSRCSLFSFSSSFAAW